MHHSRVVTRSRVTVDETEYQCENEK